MNIIVTANFSPWSPYSGGGQQSTHNVAVNLHKLGHNVHVIFTRASFEHVTPKVEVPYTLHWAQFPGFVSNSKSFLRNLSGLSVYNRCKSIIESEPGDWVIHCNGEEGAFLNRLKDDFKSNIGIVSSIRYSYFPPLALSRNKFSISDWCFKTKYNLQYLTGKRADYISTPSYSSSEQLMNTYGFDKKKVNPIHNGVPDIYLEYQRDHDAAQSGDFVFFGRLAHDKGVDVLLKAYAKLPVEIQTRHALKIIGRGDQAVELKQMATDLNINKRVQFLGWLENDQICEILTKTKICILPSIYESFGLSIASAMAVGCAVISTRTGGVPEIISNKKVGRLVNIHEINPLVEHILDLLEPTKNIELGKAASAHIRSNFTWAISAIKFIKLYHKALNI